MTRLNTPRKSRNRSGRPQTLIEDNFNNLPNQLDDQVILQMVKLKMIQRQKQNPNKVLLEHVVDEIVEEYNH